ncbi:hypothetical protein BD408DRAFT_466447, partial [Parasitella parasitica]
MSSAHRFTGCAMGGGELQRICIYIYIYISPALGYSVDANAFVSAFRAAPEAAKITVEAILALPFTFHASNGIRHLGNVPKSKGSTAQTMQCLLLLYLAQPTWA